jgi:hypothetical protein
LTVRGERGKADGMDNVEDIPEGIRVAAVLWRAADLIRAGKRARIPAAIADAGFALIGPNCPALWRTQVDQALVVALHEWQRRTFGFGEPPQLPVFDETRTPAERVEFLALAGTYAWGAWAQAEVDAAARMGEMIRAAEDLAVLREVNAAVDASLADETVERQEFNARVRSLSEKVDALDLRMARDRAAGVFAVDLVEHTHEQPEYEITFAPADPQVLATHTHEPPSHTHEPPASAPVRSIVARVLGSMLPDGWDPFVAGERGERLLSFDEVVECDRIADVIRKDCEGGSRAEYLAVLWRRWKAKTAAATDRGRTYVTSIGDWSQRTTTWRSTPSFEQLHVEGARRAVAVAYSRDLLMPAWAMAAILAAAPPDALLAQVHLEWTSLETVLVFHSALFPEVPEGVWSPRLSASWDMDRQVVSVDWPIRADYFQGDA